MVSFARSDPVGVGEAALFSPSLGSSMAPPSRGWAQLQADAHRALAEKGFEFESANQRPPWKARAKYPFCRQIPRCPKLVDGGAARHVACLVARPHAALAGSAASLLDDTCYKSPSDFWSGGKSEHTRHLADHVVWVPHVGQRSGCPTLRRDQRAGPAVCRALGPRTCLATPGTRDVHNRPAAMGNLGLISTRAH